MARLLIKAVDCKYQEYDKAERTIHKWPKIKLS